MTLVACITSGAAQAAPAVQTDTTIAGAIRKLERKPNDRDALLALGDAYARKGRETGDSGYFAKATLALQHCVQVAAEDARCRRHLAYALSLSHDFAGSAQEARQAIEHNPDDADAHGVLGDALLELGDYQGAEAAYRQMAALGQNLASLSRLSGMASLKGDPNSATRLLKRAIALGQSSEPTESVAWAQWQLGMEYLQRGKVASAQRWFEAALRTHPDYYRAHAGLGWVAAARRQDRAAIERFNQAMAIVPLPEYAAALGDLHTRLGEPEQASQHYALVGQIARLSGANLFNREYAMFALNHGDNPSAALESAQAELNVRRDIYGYDTYAWALHHNGRPQEAAVAIEQALRLGTRDARLLYHAGMIYRALGEHGKSRRMLGQALTVNPQFDILLADQARQLLMAERNSGRARRVPRTGAAERSRRESLAAVRNAGRHEN